MEENKKERWKFYYSVFHTVRRSSGNWVNSASVHLFIALDECRGWPVMRCHLEIFGVKFIFVSVILSNKFCFLAFIIWSFSSRQIVKHLENSVLFEHFLSRKDFWWLLYLCLNCLPSRLHVLLVLLHMHQMSNITVITLNKFGKRARGCCVHVFLVDIILFL